MKFKKYVFILFSSLATLLHLGVKAQNAKAAKGSFGIDKINKIIVWHQSDIDLQSRVGSTTGFKFNKKYRLSSAVKSLSYNKKYEVNRAGKSFDLYITKLPVIQIDVDTLLNENTKVLGRYRYYNKGRHVKSGVGIEYRGNLSLTYPKKTYDLEFWSDSIKNKSRDIKFKNLRNDDDWILDGMYNEPLRIRSYVANNLWAAIQTPDSRNQESNGKNGIDLVFVEVFMNRKYLGVFALSESVDRKLLHLEKSRNQVIKGELFKASSYEGGPAFKKAPDYENLFPHWAGFEMIYPILDYKSHWQDLYQLVNLTVNASDQEFSSEIGKKMDLENVVDYFLFVNLLRATDNLGKNYYLARDDENSPYFFIPWDLDGIMGIIQDGKRIATTDDILSNGLFDRLLKVNPDGYREKLKKRWAALRKSEFSEVELLSTIEDLYNSFKMEKVYDREFSVWSSENVLEDDYIYLKSWLEKRLIFLDSYFEDL